jgi:hypothetical protein
MAKTFSGLLNSGYNLDAAEIALVGSGFESLVFGPINNSTFGPLVLLLNALSLLFFQAQYETSLGLSTAS